MPSELSLTPEQRQAAAAPIARAFIEAAPGAGKTTVAAERYGVARYVARGAHGRVLGLTFARSARRALAERIRSRWGTLALIWPHEVITLDALHIELITHLLQTALIQWPGGHNRLTVLDTWRGQAGSRYMTTELAYRRVISLVGNQVTSAGVRIRHGVYGIGNREDFDRHLASGLCTHEEVRQLLAYTLRRETLRAALVDYLLKTVRAIVVDEVFDANALDLAIITMACVAGIPATLIGDPWQALYDFRGARPDLVPNLVATYGFQTYPVTRSFRFETDEMRQVATGSELACQWT